MRRTRRLAAAAALTGMLSLSVATSAAAAEVEVSISGFAFDPQTVNVTVGDTVTWMNNDQDAHTATGEGGSFNAGQIPGGNESTRVTFDTVGTFPYICAIHPDMRGTVVVEAASAGGGAGASTPPTDTEPTAEPVSPATDTVAVTLAILGLVMVVGTILVDRRLSRPGATDRKV